jgi:hypothetical protein
MPPARAARLPLLSDETDSQPTLAYPNLAVAQPSTMDGAGLVQNGVVFVADREAVARDGVHTGTSTFNRTVPDCHGLDRRLEHHSGPPRARSVNPDAGSRAVCVRRGRRGSRVVVRVEGGCGHDLHLRQVPTAPVRGPRDCLRSSCRRRPAQRCQTRVVASQEEGGWRFAVRPPGTRTGASDAPGWCGSTHERSLRRTPPRWSSDARTRPRPGRPFRVGGGPLRPWR